MKRDRQNKTVDRNTQAPRFALLSVFNKEGITDLAKELLNLGYTLISTGGTAKTLAENYITAIPIQDITGNPESFGGRMKTISFQVGAGILYDRSNPSHIQQAEDLNIKPIDIVVCNLYPFEKTVENPKVLLSDAIENIDVGGPTLIRAAAKNFKHVLVVIDPKDYPSIIEKLQNNSLTQEFRCALSAKAFAHVSFYDAQITHFFSSKQFPEEITLPGRKLQDLRYGENPHQKAALYIRPNSNSPFKNLQKHAGRDMSLVNCIDLQAGIDSVKMFDEPTAVVVKHASPCGIALGKSSSLALKLAIEADPESAFGGVIVLNGVIDKKTAKVITSFKDVRRGNIDIVACRKIDADALEILTHLRKSMGVYTFGRIPKKSKDIYNLKWLDGGFILQEPDRVENSFTKWEVVTKIKPTKKQLLQMQTAWKFISRIRSNAVIVVDKTLPMTRGIGTSQTSRVRSTRIALSQAGTYAKGAILASDSFFPFEDSVKLAARYGIKAIVQQGDSINDKASINAANKAGITMVFTHRRAFWH